MIKISNNSKIYIVSPYMKYGGPRSLHQLCDKLIEKNFNAFIVYVNDKNMIINDKPLFDEYSINTTCSIEDDENNILIVPEAMTWFLFNYKKIKKVVWWLSYYYYAINDIRWFTKIALERRGLPSILYPIIYIKKLFTKTNNKYINTKDEFENVYHLYNSDYAYQKILKKGAIPEKCCYLCGPLISEYFNVNKNEIIDKKENIVAYNPLKVDKYFINKIKKCFIDTGIKFIRISNMTSKEVIDVLKKAKVYIDFGYHPGVERMPREAVSYYCNIITSNLGTASNNIDVPINNKYKFSVSFRNIDIIASMIYDMVYKYNDYINDFDKFREKINKQQEDFINSISYIFEEINL